MESADINWLAVVVAAIVPMLLGALWYSPVLFAQPWMRAVGRTPEDLTGDAPRLCDLGRGCARHFGGAGVRGRLG